jgi:hypothetical protein
MERNNNSREILKDIIENFSTEKFIHFFRNKNTSFRPMQEDLSNYNDENFTSGEKIGEIEFQDNNLTICAFQVLKELTERSGKKKQYELGKKILKETNTDAGIFIFYDRNGNFRFSLIYTEYFGTRRKFSYFKRFTYFVSPRLTNKTFLEQIGEGDFSTLEKIKEAFSIEPVTKQFYQEIANWYFWAVKKVRFPDDAEKEPNGRNMAVIRLITRIIFIWFMKERRLVPNELFNEKNLSDILKDFHPSNDNYYKAILQNLFFATLNTKQEERRFRSNKRGYKGFNTDFGNHNVYRYENLFKNSEEAIEKYFLPIPFLNGGLFECLDYKSKNKEERKYIDGFTDLKKYQPQVPNYLFFAEEEIVDLSEDYNDTKYRRTKVKGLIKTLSQYNFTIDENEPDDVEIALDPELLGKVFENLLASYNPETATTARKATGSYYTPREIVDYMVDESLKEYFKTHIPEIEEEKLNKLFSKEDTTNPFDKEISVKLINLIDALRIVDPAVGSGAFPMRVLSRLVFLLHKLDPDNSQWKKIQIDGILKSVKDPILQKELINQVEKRFKEKNPDYGRKLYLIEKCIYGVDIQQIAVEIAKLRFFISLLVDEAIDFDKKDENYGIEPLPNLDFKIMQGNSLISSFYGIYFKQEPKSKGMLFDLDEKYKQLISEFEELKSQYQNEPDVFKKQDLRKKIDEKIVQIFEEKLKEYLPEVKKIEERAKQFQKQNQRNEYIKLEKEKLFKKLGFDLEKAKEELIAYTEGRKEKNFFLWDIYFAEVFAEKGGFDIVIGNPPYVDSEIMSRNNNEFRKRCTEIFQSAKGNWDLFVVFIEKGFSLLSRGGTITYIVPNKLIAAKYTEEIRKMILSKKIIEIRDYSNVRVFKEQDVYPIVFIIQNNINKINVMISKMSSITEVKIHNEVPYRLFYQDIYWDKYFVNPEILQVIIKISQHPPLIHSCPEILGASTVSEAYEIKNYLREYHQGPFKGIKKFINTGTIDPYTSLWGQCKTQYIKNSYIKPIIFDSDIIKVNRMRLAQANSNKIIIAGLSKRLECFFDTGEYLAGKSTIIILESINNKIQLKFLLSLLNSKLISFWYKIWFKSLSLAGGYLQISPETISKIPIPQIEFNDQKPFITLADQILSVKNQNPEADTSRLEREIDRLVYKLYDLGEEEIKIIESS